jgi:energy-converting hydrogenase Eha subunit G
MKQGLTGCTGLKAWFAFVAKPQSFLLCLILHILQILVKERLSPPMIRVVRG